jgi:riboflavin biosynthesis pyrimidine reductase
MSQLRVTFPSTRHLAEPAPGALDAELRALYRHEPGTVRLNLIASVDGKAAGPDGSSRSINGPEDVRVLKAIRSWADAVVVGAGTARAERYTDVRVPPAVSAERERLGQTQRPALAIVTRSGELPGGLSVAWTWVLAPSSSPVANALTHEWSGRLIFAGDDALDARTAIDALHSRGMSRIVCEGGPQLAATLLSAGVVDEFCLTHSPLTGGEHAPLVPPVPAGMVLRHRLEAQKFTMERWVRPVHSAMR